MWFHTRGSPFFPNSVDKVGNTLESVTGSSWSKVPDGALGDDLRGLRLRTVRQALQLLRQGCDGGTWQQTDDRVVTSGGVGSRSCAKYPKRRCRERTDEEGPETEEEGEATTGTRRRHPLAISASLLAHRLPPSFRFQYRPLGGAAKPSGA